MASEDRILTVRIRREDPGCGKARFMQEYEVPRARARRVLDVLEYIQEEVDPSLAWRTHVCRDTCCYACWIVVNGRKAMACTAIIKLEQAEILLEPLADFELIRDLAIDYSKPIRERR